MTAGLEWEEDPFEPAPRSSAFHSLRLWNFRLMATSYLFSHTGYWMQIAAMSWLVLTLTGDAAAVGITSALMFLPTVILGMSAGVLVDRHPKRRILLIYYVGWVSLTALLAILTLTNVVLTWQVWVIAVGMGVCQAFGWPAQQAFVPEMVGVVHVRGAISITSSVGQLSALMGPAIGGILIGVIGPGGSFLVAAVAYAVPLIALGFVRPHELHISPPIAAERGQLMAGLRYAANRPDILWPSIMIAIFGIFTGNLGITLAVYAQSVFFTGSTGYGLLNAVVAAGALIGALISGRLHKTRLRILVMFGLSLSALYAAAAFISMEAVFCIALVSIGAMTLLLQTSANSTVQLAAHGTNRGRVIALYLMMSSIGVAVGGPVTGVAIGHFGPQGAILTAGIVMGAALAVIAITLAMRLRRGRP